MAKSLKEVLKHLEPEFQDVIEAYRFDGEINDSILTYAAFERLMMADGWILSDKTVQQKWKLLLNNGIITAIPSRTDRARLNAEAFCTAAGYASYAAEKNKKIIFETADEQGADA